MQLLKKCWAPCFTLTPSSKIDLELGCKLIAIYTGVLHFLTLTYAACILNGGQSDTFYSPLFEFSKNGMFWFSVVIIIYSILFIFAGSIGLIYGIRTEVRFLYMPWLYMTAMELILMVFFGIFMVYRYYHYLWATFASLILWSYAGYQGYLFYAVVSQYYYLKDIQEPTFIILYP